VTAREFPGALALGLLASLGAHAALYGGDHEMGGNYHALLLQAALAGSVALLALFGSVASGGAAHVTDGSVLATRLARRLPGLASLVVATSFWYVLAERIEPHHAGAPLAPSILALAVAAWIVLRLAKAIVKTLAGAVFAALRSPWAARTPRWIRRAPFLPIARRSPLLRRRFARPPPSVAIARA
jgi:hypothetical protein